ncbi:MAG: hypothetical protein IT381_25435 [Deltaproteobacteria bacterium]|nr:hypothetical protein [Deltaproteobacteria bacterium]
MLTHPLREALRRVIAEEPISGEELDELHERIAEKFPNGSNIPGTLDTVASASVGVGEGVAIALKQFVETELAKMRGGADKGFKAGQETSHSLAQKLAQKQSYVGGHAVNLQKEVGKFAALVGAVSPPDPKATDKLIEQVVTMAKANKARLELGSSHAIEFPKLKDFAEMGQGLLGVNGGKDKIEEVRVALWGGKARQAQIHAWDSAGFHVLNTVLDMHAPGEVWVEELQASHGRNCTELFMAQGGEKVPGRGNAGLVAAGLEAVIVKGVQAGVHAIVTRPGSPQVQRLYEKMGFTTPGETKPWRKRVLEWAVEKLPVVPGLMNAATMLKQGLLEAQGKDMSTMRLDLTNPEAVRQALVGFRLARATIKDVPKDIGDKMKAMGQKPDKPDTTERARLEGNNVRVIREDD